MTDPRGYKYDEQKVKVLLDLIERGTPITHAVAAIGITYQTYSNWCSDFEQFELRVRQAEFNFMQNKLAEIDKAGAREIEDAKGNKRVVGDWRVQEWRLKKRFPKIFGDQAELNIRGELDHNVALDGISDDQLKKMYQQAKTKEKDGDTPTDSGGVGETRPDPVHSGDKS